jgi:hypothetical protein
MNHIPFMSADADGYPKDVAFNPTFPIRGHDPITIRSHHYARILGRVSTHRRSIPLALSGHSLAGMSLLRSAT